MVYLVVWQMFGLVEGSTAKQDDLSNEATEVTQASLGLVQHHVCLFSSYQPS
jgi:hypothetical protein